MNRKDKWSISDDILLARIVLECVSQGKSQLTAFDICEQKLGRTAAACGFRWNSEVRKQYEDSLRDAKIAGRSARKSGMEIKEVVLASVEIDNQSIGEFDLGSSLNAISNEFRRLKQAYDDVCKENMILREKLAEQPAGDDLRVLIQLMQQARKLGLTEEKTS